MAFDIAELTSRHGTAVVLGVSGASGVTVALNLDNLASGSGRMSASIDLGANRPPFVVVEPHIESGSAPTAGGSFDIYLAWSTTGSSWPGGVSGSDGAWPADGNEDEWARQLGLPVCQVIATNDGNTLQKQSPVKVPTVARHLCVVVDNNWDQGTRNQATDTDNLGRIYITPDFDGADNP